MSLFEADPEFRIPTATEALHEARKMVDAGEVKNLIIVLLHEDRSTGVVVGGADLADYYTAVGLITEGQKVLMTGGDDE